LPKHASIYFKATLILVFALLSLVLALCLYALFAISTKDEQVYRKLVESANPINSNIKASPYTAKQQRKGVQKDILLTQGGDRLQVHLTSPHSILVLDRQDGKMEIIEKMENVKCTMQEELFYSLSDGREVVRQPSGKLVLRESKPSDPAWIEPDISELKPMQHVRYIEADHATYYYKNDRIIADDVKISRFTLPGHALITSFERMEPTMTGTAKNVEFSLKGKDLQFTAHQLKAIFYDSGSFL
jgi:hypothetical protein